MADFRSWFHTETGRRITADEIIALTRSLQLNPLLALTDLGRITEQEIWGYLESDGQLVETAEGVAGPAA